MSDTTRNPDDATERGTVATGEQPDAPGAQANGAAAAEPAAGGNGAGGTATADTGAAGGAHAAGPSGGGGAHAGGPSGPEVAGGAHAAGPPGPDVAGGAHAAGQSDAASPGPEGAPGAGRQGPVGGPPGTARQDPGGTVRDVPAAGPAQPTPPRGAAQIQPPPVPAGPAQFTPPRGAPPVSAAAGRPVPVPRPGGPEAGADQAAGPQAPGAVPGPGPGAAPPPPWRRMPGRERAEHPRPDATGLLDEGPTAFMEAPRVAAPAGSPPGSGGGSGWSMRAMRSRPPRQAALQLKRLDPWSVLKLALVLAVVLFFIWLVAVGVLYGVLDGMGVWDRLNGTYADLVSGQGSGSPLISAGRVFAVAAVVGAINSLLFAVAVTLAAFIYNVSADLVGGVEVTLSERD